MRRHDTRGMSLIEVLLALGLVSCAMMAAVYFLANTSQGTRHNKQKEYAVQKAISMFDELKALVEDTTGTDITILDDYDDGTTYKTVLTTQDNVVAADDRASGNVPLVGGRWLYERQISVQRFPSLQTNDIRLVNVRVYGKDVTDATRPRRLLAEVSGVIRTLADKFPPTQVYDVYCLAVENVPGWWVYMANLIPFVENAISDLQGRNPGLQFRTHWIRKLAYGRDPYYTPFINDTNDSNADIDWAYFYPGLMPAGSAVNYYYVPTHFNARIRIDDDVHNDFDATANPWPYTLADHFNNAMRYPDEVALFNARLAAGLESADRPTWRMLLEDLYSHPEKYQNAILINVHGELFPFPPVRNYSDAAKDPEDHAGARVVTHPEKLGYGNGDDIKLRVYSYLTEPNAIGAPDRLDEPIVVTIKGVTGATINVRAIEGGFDLNGDGTADSYAYNDNDTTNDYAGDMFSVTTTSGSDTVITLYNSPLKTPCVGAGCAQGGLATGKRLYAMEYLPSPLGTGATPFDRDLTNNTDVTKNTARWVITIDRSGLTDDQRFTFETRIGTDVTYGTVYPTANRPYDLSRTYVWRGTDLWLFGDGTSAHPPNLPLTERFQFMGDPRHCPYQDLRVAYDPATAKLGTGYNRYFDDFHNGAGNMANDANTWQGWSGVRNNGSANDDGWNSGSGYLEIDVNRAYQMLRMGLMRSNAIWTTMSGFSYYYIGIGNEIGYDSANGFPNSIPTSPKPFDGTSGTRNENTITDAQSGGVKYIRANDGSADPWWGVTWLGEMFPDAEWDNWRDDGNLASGTGAGTFVRVKRNAITNRLPVGTTFLNGLRRLTEEGSTTFFSIGTNTSKFHHEYRDGQTGSLEPQGFEIANHYNFAIPATVTINRPFNTNRNSSGGVPTNYLESTYTGGAALTTTRLATYFNHQDTSLVGAALQTITGSGNDNTYIAVNGIAQTTQTGSAFLGRWGFLSLIESYLEGGRYSSGGRVVQVPRVQLTAPNDLTDLNNPSTISISWDRTWRRWDGLKYTDNYADSFTESTPLSYVLTYSNDSGRSWRYMVDDTIATPGVRPASNSLVTTSTSYSWSVPAGPFPRGSYIVRVEAYRDGFALHYAYHQEKIYIKR